MQSPDPRGQSDAYRPVHDPRRLDRNRSTKRLRPAPGDIDDRTWGDSSGRYSCPYTKSVDPLCQFCSIESSIVANTPAPRWYDRPLSVLPNLYVIPALGPLVVGHVLVVARSHIVGIRASPSTAVLTDYETLAMSMRHRCEVAGLTLLELEHGSSHAHSSGPCIEHAHVHMLPGIADQSDLFAATFPAIESSSSALRGISYFWVRTRANVVAYDATGARRQEPRILLAERLGLPSWDWLAAPNYAKIRKTISFWSSDVQ